MQPTDIIIENGYVFDGSGAPWIKTDIAVRGDRIVGVGEFGDMEAGRRIDASGLYVAPGFIDVHSHAGEGLATPELSHAEPLLAQGLTTVMANPDGRGADGDLVPMDEGVPHPRSYGTFPRILAQYSRDEDVVPLSTAIHSMTGLPATVYRMADRGFIRNDMVADITVFDLEALREVGTFTDPHHLAEGIEYVLVNGELAADAGSFTGAMSGRVLDRQGGEQAPGQ